GTSTASWPRDRPPDSTSAPTRVPSPSSGPVRPAVPSSRHSAAVAPGIRDNSAAATFSHEVPASRRVANPSDQRAAPARGREGVLGFFAVTTCPPVKTRDRRATHRANGRPGCSGAALRSVVTYLAPSDCSFEEAGFPALRTAVPSGCLPILVFPQTLSPEC